MTIFSGAFDETQERPRYRRCVHLHVAAALIAATCLPLGPAFAHHFFATEYERELRGTIVGTVEAVAFTQPHVRVDVRVRDAAGKEEVWSANTVSPSALPQHGWTAATIAVGDIVIVEGFLGRSGSKRIWIQRIAVEGGPEIYPVGREDG